MRRLLGFSPSVLALGRGGNGFRKAFTSPGSLRSRSGSDPLFELVGNFARLDHMRSARTGFPEVIFGEGKTKQHIANIFATMVKSMQEGTGAYPAVLATRVSQETFDYVKKECPSAQYLPESRLVVYPKEVCDIIGSRAKQPEGAHRVAVVAAGTADYGVAEEAVAVCVSCGIQVSRFYDVGVAGIHRLLAVIPEIRDCDAVICVAGMEGALPSVLAGLLDAPLVAVPTSVGYGAAQSGMTPMLAMLTGCAPGVAIVNIDNGFGAAAMVAKILRVQKRKEDREQDQAAD